MLVRILRTTNVVVETSVVQETNQLAHAVSAAKVVFFMRMMTVTLLKRTKTSVQRIGERNRMKQGQ